MNIKILKPNKLAKKKFPLFWEEYEELKTKHEFMFFKLWIAPNGKNKQNKYYIEEPHTLTRFKEKPNPKPPFPSLSLFKSRPNRHLHDHGFQISSLLISSSLLKQTLLFLFL